MTIVAVDTFEGIVRTLADGFAPTHPDTNECMLCDAEIGDHANDCPWLRARKIVAS